MNTTIEAKPNTMLWTHDQFKAVRHQLGLTVTELAYLLDTDRKSIRCIECDPSQGMHRKPAPRMVRLMEAYLAGYRPVDWPQD